MSDTPITKGMMDRAAQDVFLKPPMTGKDTVIAFINFITDEVIALEHRLIAAEAENAALREDAERVPNLHLAAVNLYLEGAAAFEEANASLKEEIAALREDAERYRWLRDDCHDTPIGVYEWTGMNGAQRRIFLNAEELDDAIDAARKS